MKKDDLFVKVLEKTILTHNTSKTFSWGVCYARV